MTVGIDYTVVKSQPLKGALTYTVWQQYGFLGYFPVILLFQQLFAIISHSLF